jgi:glucose/arabinose dehydrogenase
LLHIVPQINTMYKHLRLLTASAFILFSCNTSAPVGNDTTAPGNTAPGDPVETKSPNTDYKPAFAGQTRIASVKTTTPYTSTVISSDLESPWAVIPLPDGRLLITQKEGTMRIATTAGKLSAEITGIPPVNAGGQGGLLDVALDPNFATNRMLYWSFSHATNGGNLTAVAKGRLSNDETKIENAIIIYQAVPAYNNTMHYGSRIAFDNTGNMFVSTGERSDLATRPKAQYPDAALGKVVRITTDGKPAPGNPFLNNNSTLPEIYSLGHRNVQSLAIHPVTGELWEAEMGPRGGDELNRISSGKNYGWPLITYGIEYTGEKISNGATQKEGLEQPVYYWDPVLSPSGMTFYNSDVIPEWKNNLFIGGLSSMHIARLVIENNKVVGEERLLAGEGQRFRDVAQGKDGALYAVTDGGRLYRISKTP